METPGTTPHTTNDALAVVRTAPTAASMVLLASFIAVFGPYRGDVAVTVPLSGTAFAPAE